MNSSKRTDLASELDLTSQKGISENSEIIEGIKVNTVFITTDEAAARVGKPCGEYITIDIGQIRFIDDKHFDSIAHIIAKKLSDLAIKLCNRFPKSVLIAGLGNRNITADALGSQTVELLTVTRHLKERNRDLFKLFGEKQLSAIAPGVLGQTGIETAEYVLGICEQICPELVVVIDSLCARSTSRLATTVQLGSSGISPGSGIGNHRRSITKESVGVPVIAFGVPTVVDSATLVLDALENAGINTIDEKLEQTLKDRKDFFVTPKETDFIVRELSRLTAKSISIAFGGLE